jgi:ABC-type sugar transport system ATPase subunit
MTLADRVIVLDRGKVQQIGPPDELYRYPNNVFVASFIGSPSMNLFDADMSNGKFQLGGVAIDTGLDFSGSVKIGIRPEALRLENGIPATVIWVEDLGLHFLVGLRIGTESLSVSASQRPASESVAVCFDPGDVHVFEKHSGANIGRSRSRRPLSA